MRPALPPLALTTLLALGLSACAGSAPDAAPPSTGPARSADGPGLRAAAAGYEAYVVAQADELLARTGELVAAVKAGDVARARALYPLARAPWERIEPVAESFGDLDPRVDGREDVVAEGREFTGYHRLEKDLWVDGLRPESSAVADRLLADVGEVATRAKAVRLDGLDLARGAKELLDEMATGKVTGEEERYSHTDLHDFAANWEGTRAALDALRPVLTAGDPALVAAYDARAGALGAALARHRVGEGYRVWTDLSAADVAELSRALDAVSEQVARAANVVARA